MPLIRKLPLIRHSTSPASSVLTTQLLPVHLTTSPFNFTALFPLRHYIAYGKLLILPTATQCLRYPIRFPGKRLLYVVGNMCKFPETYSRLLHTVYLQTQRGWSCLKKSLPLSSTRMNAGKSSTSIFQIASMPSSGYSTHSIDLILFWARIAAGPPIEPR